MKTIPMVAVFGVAAFVMATPSIASGQSTYGYQSYDQHDQRHDRLDNRHDNNHDELNEEHADAHDYGLNRREHRQLHGELQYQHAEADYRIARQHQLQDRRAWQRRYYQRDYNQYYGY